MPDSCLHLELDGTTVSDAALRELGEVQVEEAADIADGASLVARVEARDDGEWRSVLDPLTAPEAPVVVGVSYGDVRYRFDGYSTEASWQLDADGASQLTVKALDRTLALDREEKVVAWPGRPDSAIAEAIISTGYGLLAHVQPTPIGPDADVHVVLQRGSDLAFLRSLADKWGYSFYIEADGKLLTGHFRRIDPLAKPQAELALGFGGDARKVEATVQLTAGRRMRGARIAPLARNAVSADSAGDDEAQGPASLAGVATVLLSPEDVDGEVEPLEAARGLARRSAFAATLSFELDTARAGVMLRARRPVLVKGLGAQLSGRYLVQRVRHTVTLEQHHQQVTLVRNALGLTGDEPFGRLGGSGGAAVIERCHGKYLGRVHDNEDPKRLTRIRAIVPEILGDVPTGWCVPCSPYAGPGVGLAAVPPPGSLVFVEWPAGDTTRVPIWSGAMWPADEGIEGAGHDAVALVTPGGHRVLLRDTGGEEAIEITSASGATVTLDADGVAISFGSQRIAVTRSAISFNDGALEVRR